MNIKVKLNISQGLHRSKYFVATFGVFCRSKSENVFLHQPTGLAQNPSGHCEGVKMKVSVFPKKN